jgi:multicomponent Na+:H+ antiporter subunit B
VDLIIKTTSRILFPFVLLMGIYVAIHGHISPGGGFSGGAIIATGFALLVIAYTEGDVEHRFTKGELVDIKAVSGLILLILIISMGFAWRMELLRTQTPLALWSGGFTPLLNITGALMVITAIVTIIYALVKE